MRRISSTLKDKIHLKEQTHFHKANPKMSVSIARARTPVMNNSYFTVETIRTKEGLGDISIGARRLKPYGPPDKLYEIHLENGIIKTATRNFKDQLKEGWKEQFTLGEGKAIAIAFDGNWQLNNRRLWQMITFEKPYVFYVRPDGDLFCKLWDEEEEIQLSKDVCLVKAIRGWKSPSIKIDDMGLIVGYIKNDGKVYYRNYCRQEDGSYIWEYEKEIVEFNKKAIHLNIFMTNDYRVGFIIEDDTHKIYWHITKRNWAGMAIAPEKIHVKPGYALIDIIYRPIIYTDSFARDEYIVPTLKDAKIDIMYAGSYNQFISIENKADDQENWGKIIEFTVLHEIFDTRCNDFELIDCKGTKIYPSEIKMVGTNKYRLKFTDGEAGFNDAVGEVKVIFKGLYGVNAAGYKLDAFEKSFIPIHLEPTLYPLPKVEVIWNE